MTIPYWDDQPDVFDTLTIAGYVFASTYVNISGPRCRKLDAKNAPGTDGGSQKDLGYELSELSVEWYIYNEDHWTTLQSLLPIIMPIPGKTLSSPYTVLHPMLELFKLSQMRTRKLHLPRKVKQGVYSMKIDGLEYLPAKTQGTGSPPPAGPGVSNIFDGGNQNSAAPAKPSTTNTGP